MKLENIFISGDGRVRLGDFGLTMSMKQELAISPVGTVEYMAPEASPLSQLPERLPHGCVVPDPAESGSSVTLGVPTLQTESLTILLLRTN